MIKRVVFTIVAVAVIVAGYTGSKKLNYWPRSIRIFSYSPNEAYSRGGERDRSEGREHFIPDSIRHNESFRRPQRNEFSHNDDMRANQREQSSRGEVVTHTETVRSNAGFQRTQGNASGRDGFRERRKINLRNVGWYMSVFASFTVLSICSDRTARYVRSKMRKT